MAVKKPKRKNAAAVALSKRQLQVCPPEERSARARSAVQARWNRAKAKSNPQSARWYGLFAIEDDPNHPQVLKWSRDRGEIQEASRKESQAGRAVMILDVDYDPTRFTMVREFRPDAAKQVEALKMLVNARTEAQR